MHHLDELHLVRDPAITHAQWEAIVAAHPALDKPDHYAACRVFLYGVELDTDTLYVWTGHSSNQHFPVFYRADGIHFTSSGDAETAFFVQDLALALHACVVHPAPACPENPPWRPFDIARTGARD